MRNMDFETQKDFLEYVAKIEKALRKQNLNEISLLLNHKCQTLSEAISYFNNVWKKQVRIKEYGKIKYGYKNANKLR